MADTRVQIAGLSMKNPVVAASGCFGFGREYGAFVDLNRLGGISVKGLTLKPRAGNPPPRVAETPAGLLNSVGLQNPGVHAFLRDELPRLRSFDVAVIANAAGSTLSDYVELCGILGESAVDAVELNLSCPNVKAGCMAFGATVAGITEAVRAVRAVCGKTLIVKLTPNVGDIAELARAAEAEGADALSLINTLLGMVIDVEARRPVLANNTGGLSGPAVRPIAVRMTWEVAQAVKVPVVGMGGIETGSDAMQFLLAGASAVMVGSASFVDPSATVRVAEEIEAYLDRHGMASLSNAVGALKLNG